MSPVNFEHLAKQNPKYRRALREVEAWINAHPQDRVLNPSLLNSSELRFVRGRWDQELG